VKTLWLDRETYGECDLKEVGTYVYAASAQDLLVSYAIDDGPAKVWDCTAEPCPADLLQAMAEAEEVVAHNAAFDKAIHNGAAQAHLPRIPLSRWRCSMAQALSHALPGGLDDLCRVLNVPTDMAKDKDGKRLIRLFCMPQPTNRKVQRATRETHPEDWEKFKNYAVGDIVAMRECVKRMPSWNWDASAIAEWHCDQRINERGFYVDRELTAAGARAAVVEKERIGHRFRQLTEGVVDRPSQRAQFQAFLNERFALSLDNTRSDTFLQVLKDTTLDPRCAELMRLAIASNKTSTAKYAALHPAVSDDSRFRGGLQFAGASRTRRWAGRLFQPQNLPSRGLPDADDVEFYIQCLKEGTHDLFFDDLMRYGAAALRGIVVSAPKHKLEVADLSNIEGRMLSWVSEENWKLAAFRDYDAGTGPDLYCITASSILGGDPWKVSKKDRNVFGKVPDLASGYQGGVAGYQTFARAYNVRMADHWDTIQKQINPALVAKAQENFNTNWGRESQIRLEISPDEWIASEACKLAWRARHPATVRFWYALQSAAMDAISHWGSIFKAGSYIKMRGVTHKGQRWLVVQLPSGRYLTYFDPRVIDGSLSYMGEAAEEGKTTRQWVRVFTHGGKMTGNCLSASAKILTAAGAKSIVDVSADDLVWDGVEWVRTDGVIAQGKKEVGEWLGLQITQDHLIHDGNSWKPVMQLGERCTQDALSSAASSVRSPSFAATPQTAALQTAFASAARPAESPCGSFGETRACGAEPAPAQNSRPVCAKTRTSSLTTHCASHGLTATRRLSGVAQTLQTLRTPTTEGEASTSATNGGTTGEPSFATCGHCPDGTKQGWTSTAETTTEATSPATCGLSSVRSTATTSGPIGGSFSTEKTSPHQSSGESIAPPVGRATPCPTTSTPGEHLSKLWRSTGQRMEVFDLLNCGPRNRFTVLTDAGPVLVHNCCQTLARDILMPALQTAEQKGYLPILSVHDEAICEVPDTDEYSAGGLIDILATNPPWSKGLPLAAAGFETTRYRKE